MPFWPVADYLAEFEPDGEIDQALAALHRKALAGTVLLSGCRCSWNHSGQRLSSYKRRKPIPVLDLVGQRLAVLPDDSDIVLIPDDDSFLAGPMVGEVNNYGGGVTWVKADYGEYLGPVNKLRGEVKGWGRLWVNTAEAPLSVSKEDAVRLWRRQKYPTRTPPGVKDKELWREFENDNKGSKVGKASYSTFLRGLDKKKRQSQKRS